MTIAHTETLLVVSDFDGTLAGFNTDIYAVPVNRRSIEALKALSKLPNTHVAVLSGRHLEGLKKVVPLREPVMLAGSHGNESSVSSEPTPEQAALLDEVDRALSEIMVVEGTGVEKKPFQRVAHTLELSQRDPAAAEEVLRLAWGVDVPGVKKTAGKNIVEFSCTSVTKGDWISKTRAALGATGTIFLGDDVTDEDGFAVLGENDLGVKVGEGETRATHRVAGLDEVADFLSDLAVQRAEWAK